MITLPIKFLQKKIQELQSALFLTDSDSLVKMPTHVISSAEADDAGNIWFIIPKPSQHVNAFDETFSAKLDFFKKGKGFYLKVQGNATIVANKKEIESVAGISDDMKSKMDEQTVVAIKVKVQTADYFENLPRPSSTNWILSGTTHLYNWLFNSRYDYKNPQLMMIPISIDSNMRKF
ncbi:MAG: pyridoxamine 5'-phosphate oxidase family protein [Bacteroidetes bacterium]|nr:pyridoxamine 5'-phosphate oxidase family protein [Bacteroidota bacterium]